MSATRQKISGIFYLALAEAQDFTKVQPGENLVHVNDVQEVLNKAEHRILTALGISGDNE